MKQGKVKLYVRTCKRIYQVIRDEIAFSEEEANPRLVYTELKPHIVKPQTVLDRHDYMHVRKFIRNLRKDRDLIPIIKRILIILCICLPIALGFTIYLRLHQRIIYGTYIDDYPLRNFTIRVQDNNDPTKTYVVDYGTANIYDRNGHLVHERKNLFENDPTTGWGVGNDLNIRVERIDSDGIYQANQIIDYSIPQHN